MYTNYCRRNNAIPDKKQLKWILLCRSISYKVYMDIFWLSMLWFVDLVPINLRLMRRDSQIHNILFNHVFLQYRIISKVVWFFNKMEYIVLCIRRHPISWLRNCSGKNLKIFLVYTDWITFCQLLFKCEITWISIYLLKSPLVDFI